MKVDKNILLTVLLVGVLIAAGYYYINFSAEGSVDLRFGDENEGFENDQMMNLQEPAENIHKLTPSMSIIPVLKELHEPDEEEDKVEKPEEVREEMTNPAPCQPRDSLSPEELLPQDYSSTWAKNNPTGASNLDGKNFLDAGWHVGINTVGQTLRNANLQLRSEPPNPQVVVSPFVQSTIQPDTNRRHFEVGSC